MKELQLPLNRTPQHMKPCTTSTRPVVEAQFPTAHDIEVADLLTATSVE
jgi:hypothetical protein